MPELNPTATAEARAPPLLRMAEVDVQPNVVVVTAEIPELAPSDALVVVTPGMVTFLSRQNPFVIQAHVKVSVRTNTARFVVRHAHGVFDVILERTHKSH